MYIVLYIVLSLIIVAFIVSWLTLRREPARRDSICLKLSLALAAVFLLLAIIRPKYLFFGLSNAGLWLISY